MSFNFSQVIFLFAHGAGADMQSEWMLDFDNLLSQKGIKVVRFNFPYMIKRSQDGKRRPPDRQSKLLQAFAEQIEKLISQGLLSDDTKLFIGGKSMGGRMASLLTCDSDYQFNIDGVICLGFPFHPAKRLDKFKGEHLATINTPTLILQGERDVMGNKQEVLSYLFSDKVTVHFLTDGDHSFKPRVKSGVTYTGNLQQAAACVLDFIRDID